MLIFEVFLPLKKLPMANFIGTGAHTSRKYVLTEDIKLPKSSEKHILLLPHSSFFVSE